MLAPELIKLALMWKHEEFSHSSTEAPYLSYFKKYAE
jgi:hypothetical protein